MNVLCWVRLLLACSLLLLSPVASAQPVGLLPLGVPDDALLAVSEEVSIALRARGLSVVDAEGLRTLLRAEGYEPYRTAPEWAEELQAVGEAALQDAAFGRFERVRASADAQLDRADRVLAWLGTQPQLAHVLGDLCLYAMRADLRVQKPEAARARAERCLRALPALRPSPDAHPENVLALLDEARRAPAQGAELTLSAPEASAGCAPRLQGQPLSQQALQPLGEYVVSLDCSREGLLVRRVTLPAEGLRVRVPVALLRDLSLQGSTLHLRSVGNPAAALDELSGFVHVQAFVLVEARPEGPPRLHYLVRGDSGFTTRAFVHFREHAAATVDALLADAQPQPGANAAAAPEQQTAATAEAPVAVAFAPKVGWALSAAAVSLAGAAWGTYGGFRSRDAELRELSPVLSDTEGADPAYLDQLDARDRLAAWSSALSATGATLALAAVPLLTKRPRARRIWPWVLGAVGAGIAAAGAYTLSRAGETETLADGRRRALPVVPLGPLLLSQGLALTLTPVLSETGQSPRPSRALLGFSGYF